VDPALILYLVMGLSVLVFLGFAIFMFTRDAVPSAGHEQDGVLTHADGPPQEADRRPWWARPSAWLLISAAFLFIGLFVTPKIFGGVFLFLPFFWIRGPRRRRRPHSSH
jgi:hypothetical protein